MARTRTHKDLEFHLSVPRADAPGQYQTMVTRSFDEAASTAVAVSASTGRPVTIHVVTWSRAAARAYMGDAGAEMYDEDPDASTFDQIFVEARSLGRLP